MSEIKEQQMNAAASLWMKPATFEELCKRLSKPQYGFHVIVEMALEKKWIYEDGKILKCYKKTVKEVLNPNGYELDLREPIESEFAKSLKKQGLI